jgi:serine/threonine protein kinase
MSDAALLQSTRSGMVYKLGRAFRIGSYLAYEAYDAQGRLCWVKQVRADDEAGIARLRYEAIILSKLAHPGVIRLLDRGRSPDCFFLALEPLAGRSLLQVIETTQLSTPQIYNLATQLAELLDYLHSRGIMCCTLPPDYLYLDNLDQLALVDLSAAWDQVAPPRQGAMSPKAAYLSPEEAGGTPVDRRSDSYVFGLLLFELLAGQPPFQGANRGDLALHHLLTPAPDLLALRHDIPVELAALVKRCLAKSPALRPGDASELLDALRRKNDAPTPEAPRGSAPRDSWRKWLYRQPSVETS